MSTGKKGCRAQMYFGQRQFFSVIQTVFFLPDKVFVYMQIFDNNIRIT